MDQKQPVVFDETDEPAEPGRRLVAPSAHAPAIGRRSFIMLSAAALGSLALAGCSNSQNSADEAENSSSENDNASSGEDTVTVTDFEGNEVTVTADARHIGALLGNSTGPLVFLGGGPRISLSFSSYYEPWRDVIIPDYDSYGIQTIENARDPNIEDLVNSQIDVVFYWGGLEEQVRKMNDVGIPVIVSNPSVTDFETVDDWLSLMEQEIMLYADVLGPDAVEKANEWLDWTRSNISDVTSRTADLPEDQIKRAYYLRNQEDGLQCFAGSSYPKIAVKAAGGVLVEGDVDTQGSGFTTVTMEDVIGWDPEYVFMGWLNSTDVLTSNEQWAPVSAVKNGNVYLSPCSMGSGWEYAQENALDVMYMAKIMHPDLFEDLDIVAKIQEYYQKFWGVDLTDEQAQYMIDRKGPQGQDRA